MTIYYPPRRDKSLGYRYAVKPVYILDALSVSASAAYSTRLLRANNDCPCLRLVRASDSAELDIWWHNGWIDVSAVATFLAATTCVVSWWYDQTGNGRHTSQTTAANRPDYVASSINSLPGLYFDGTDYLSLPAAIGFAAGTAYTQMYVGKKDDGDKLLVCFGGAGATYGSLMAANIASGETYDSGDGAGVSYNPGDITTASIVGSKRTTGNAVTHYLNAGSNATGTLAATVSVGYIGQRATVSGLCTGHISEAILFASALSNADRRMLRDNMNAVYACY